MSDLAENPLPNAERDKWHVLIPRLTIKRIIKTIGFFLYIITGCLFYRYYEGWDIRRSLFFTIITISTVGTLNFFL